MTPADHVNLRNELQKLLNHYGSNEVTHALEYLHDEDEDMEEGFVEFIKGTDHTVSAVLANPILREELYNSWRQDA